MTQLDRDGKGVARILPAAGLAMSAKVDRVTASFLLHYPLPIKDTRSSIEKLNSRLMLRSCMQQDCCFEFNMATKPDADRTKVN